MIKDVDETVGHLQSLGTVDSNRLGITEFCMGGRGAYYGNNTMVALAKARRLSNDPSRLPAFCSSTLAAKMGTRRPRTRASWSKS